VRDVVTVGDGTGEVSAGRWHRTTETKGISRKVKSLRKPDEKSEEAIVPQKGRTTKPVRREGSLLQPGLARK
jgi:hypothetical protein